MERKIGEIFEFGGEWYQCIIGHCNQCSFDEAGTCKFIGNPYCAYRNDKKLACFKKLEKVGDPYSCNYYGDNRLIMMQEYNLFNLDDVTNEDKIPMYITDYKHKRIAIEIKQNKEDMGDNDDIRPYDELFSPGTASNTKYLAKENMEEYRMYDAKEDIPEFDKVVDECLFGEDKLNLKPFDLEAAKAGKTVCTRDGRKARIICFDLKNDEYPIVAAVENDSSETLFSYTTNGEIADGIESDKDLMMFPEKRSGWVNVYSHRLGGPYESKEYALKQKMEDCIDTVKIFWEE